MRKKKNPAEAGRDKTLNEPCADVPKTSSSGFYETSPTKQRGRRTRAEIDSLLAAIQGILNEEPGQISIRHLFYKLSGLGRIQKTEADYKSLCWNLSKWRRSGDVAWSAFADSTRWHIRHQTFSGIDDALANTVQTYRRNLWETQPYYVEIWSEKDAIASILSRVAGEFGVPTFVCRGFASLSSLYSAAATFRAAIEAGKAPVIYHFGDYDPSGVAAGDSITSTFKNDFDVEVYFYRAAVTAEQIAELKLPTRPVKKSDTRAAKWKGGDSVEIDTLPPAYLRGLVESCITACIDPREWEALKATEAMEKETLATMLRRPRE